jgi:hypothetical protein
MSDRVQAVERALLLLEEVAASARRRSLGGPG